MFFVKAKFAFLFSILISAGTVCFAQQKISDFYLSNVKENGTKDWEVEGKEAYIYDKHVDIDEMKANYFAPDDTIVITSDRARLDKENMDVHLQDNVNVVNKEGATLKTESLDWSRSKDSIKTEDWVTTQKDDMQIKGKGMFADTKMRKADFKQDVEVMMPDEETKEVTTITCSGPLEIEYALGTAIFIDEVVVTHPQGKLFSDKATLYFDTDEKKIKQIISEGNVKIVRDDNVTFAQKATYNTATQKVILEGRPRLIYFPEDKQDSFIP
ncbi:MAG: LPS export ABC transporter periplasmic protein LptC [Candidatus Omnitrophica bacterium]|nr:LPS export ABC transporter periplasmic protein LptC [Candidatus Omnitrophota bacterium]